MKLRELKLFCHNVKSPKQGTTELKRAMKVASEMEGKGEAHMGNSPRLRLGPMESRHFPGWWKQLLRTEENQPSRCPLLGSLAKD